MNKIEVIENTIGFVKTKLDGDSSGHDWGHIFRVWNMAKKLQNKEGGDLFIIELTALLHDVANWKFYYDEEEGLELVRDWLRRMELSSEHINKIILLIKNISFKGAGVKDQMHTIEGKIVQDADRLDAIGAIGIARTFAFGGKFGNEMHNPDVTAEWHDSFEAYKKSKGTTINHFYEKLLLLKDRMNTKTARIIADERHRFMETYLIQFFDECENLK